MVLEISYIPDSGDGEGWGRVQGKAAPVPGKLERIQYVVEDTQGDEWLVYFSYIEIQKM